MRIERKSRLLLPAPSGKLFGSPADTKCQVAKNRQEKPSFAEKTRLLYMAVIQRGDCEGLIKPSLRGSLADWMFGDNLGFLRPELFKVFAG